ncbi:hypothetical protein BpHYR1_050186 [Brachionus plicatilis]|uniref:Uncharacterized protein n=1 Tax=Brachionus plicatilis TaxID=10195 RepID=A0A3M7S0N2_BRAPC|nr:hypothetical protein BpHYR1_050186 [Brachionus plicatilis]
MLLRYLEFTLFYRFFDKFKINFVFKTKRSQILHSPFCETKFNKECQEIFFVCFPLHEDI